MTENNKRNEPCTAKTRKEFGERIFNPDCPDCMKAWVEWCEGKKVFIVS